jgi:hypothetical protein
MIPVKGKKFIDPDSEKWLPPDDPGDADGPSRPFLSISAGKFKGVRH